MDKALSAMKNGDNTPTALSFLNAKLANPPAENKNIINNNKDTYDAA